MKLVDSNVWLAMALSAHEHNGSASVWFDAQKAKGSIAFCRLTQVSLLRLLTTRAVVSAYGSAPLKNEEAWSIFEEFHSDARVTFTSEPAGLDRRWKDLSSRNTPSPKLWMDAYLAAFAIQGNHQFVTLDSAFTQFEELDLNFLG